MEQLRSSKEVEMSYSNGPRASRQPNRAEEDGTPLHVCLRLIDDDMLANPENIQPLSTRSLARARALVGHLEVDRDEDLGADVTLNGFDPELCE
jgi:hypothetical protein